MNTKLLRQKILDLAIRGKLTEQKESDGTTKDLLASIAASSACHAELVSASPSSSAKKNSKATERSVILERTSNVIASEAKQSKKSKPAEPKTIIPLNKDEAPFEIPETWEWVRLGDVLADMKSTSPCGETFKYIDIDSIDNKRCVVKEPKVICTKDAPSRASRFTKKGDVLFSLVRPYLRNIAKVEEDDCIASTGFYVCSPIHLNSDYCYYLMISNYVVDGLNQFMKGDNSPSISSKNLQEWLIPLPPLAEQQRIVAAIESAFAEITAIENNQELLKKHIKQGRQKILDLAIRGKLTQQLKTDGTTKDLLASIATASACHAELVSASPSSSAKKNSKATERSVILSKRSASKDLAKEIIPLDKNEAPFEIPETWEWVKLGDLSEKIQYGYNAPAKDMGRIKMVRITDIHDNAVEWDSVPFCDIEESEIPTYLLKKNDILFARTGGTVGKSFIVNEVPEDAVYAGYLIRTRYGKNINAQYMKYFMESNLYWVQLREGCIATAQPNCNGQTLGKMRIPLPPLAEQQRIVAAIESAFTEFDAMEKGL